MPEGLLDKSLVDPNSDKATRASGGQVLNALAGELPYLLGGDADLSCSTKTGLKDAGSFEGQGGQGRNIHYGVREHAMAACANGMAYHGGVLPYTATFFCFSDYMRPSLRLAALNSLPQVHIWTHDSVWLGEDGPTHQPVEHLASLRAMPNFHVDRPADATEVEAAWKCAVARREGPTGLVLSRQGLPPLDRSDARGEAAQGGYILKGSSVQGPQVHLLATGSEVALALEVSDALGQSGISNRVVSLPCWERFFDQPDDYRDDILPDDGALRVSIEAACAFGWSELVGRDGLSIALEGFWRVGPDGRSQKTLRL